VDLKAHSLTQPPRQGTPREPTTMWHGLPAAPLRSRKVSKNPEINHRGTEDTERNRSFPIVAELHLGTRSVCEPARGPLPPLVPELHSGTHLYRAVVLRSSAFPHPLPLGEGRGEGGLRVWPRLVRLRKGASARQARVRKDAMPPARGTLAPPCVMMWPVSDRATPATVRSPSGPALRAIPAPVPAQPRPDTPCAAG